MVPRNSKGRLIIVSNRLPVSIKCTGDGTYDVNPSSGGLVTGLSGLTKSGIEHRWYGWLGMEVSQKDISHVRDNLLQKHNAVPVLLDQHTVEHYYDGFSNSTIWPLFHNQIHNVLFDETSPAAYRKANEVFADTIAPNLKDGDHVWVHDYHLMLLPLLIRQRAKMADVKIRIGWFLHTPFPDEDTFSMLPSKTEILNGILGADVVGLQTDESRRHFLSTCSQNTHWRSTHLKVLLDSREVSVGTFPIGIEPSEFHSRLQTESVQGIIRRMRAKFQGATVIVGVDRLDYIKGVPQKMQAFDKFLERHPEWIGRAILVQVTIPSRDNLELHQKLRAHIQKLVGEINGKYGKINYVPIHFLYTSLPHDELTALYTTADICFVSSTGDGMNLVSYEYIACHDVHAAQVSREAIAPGVLILSRFTGAAGLLRGALIVNPWDQEACADALADAANMNAGEACKRMRELGNKVEEQTSCRWASTFLSALTREEEEETEVTKKATSLGRTDSLLD